MKNKTESGMALATTLIVLFLVVALVVGFSWMVLVDQKLGGINGDQQYAFYGAEAGLEKLTANLGFLFSTNPSPSGPQVQAIATAATTPVIPGIQFVKPDGTLGYDISFPADNAGNPLAQNHVIVSGPYQGLTGLLTPFTLTATARNVASGAEVRLQRNVQTVAIPVFQFGMFSETDLSYFPGPNFNFGGRVHTNGNLFLASGADTWFQDKITAAGQVIRTNLSNGWPTSSGYTGNVFIPTTSGGCLSQPGATTATCRAIAMNEGSVVGGAGPPMSAPNPNWTNVSTSSPPTGYNGYIRSQKTGVSPLNLSITLNPGTFPIDLIRRGLPGEDVSNPGTLSQRYYSEASVRILLSDNLADITNLPCESATLPKNLATVPLTQMGNVPIAESDGGVNYSSTNGYWAPLNAPLVTGYIKIEVQTAYAVPPAPCGTWKDVTAEVLNFGIAGRNLNPYNSANPKWGWVNRPSLPNPANQSVQVPQSGCTDPSPNAIIRLERVRDNPLTGKTGGVSGTSAACGFTGGAPTTDPYSYWPNALFDTREGNPRDTCADGSNPCGLGPSLGGVMDYTELDIHNLARYLTGLIGVNGTLAKDATNSSYDFVVYFSDRRGNHTPAPIVGWPPASPTGFETGEYGYEDSINPTDANACPNNTLDTGETFDEVENPANQVIGGVPESYGAASPVAAAFAAYTAGAPLKTNPNCAGPAGASLSNPWPVMYVKNAYEARENSPLFFRRALKLVNGSNINLGTCPDGVACGLTIVSENPVYVQGDFNASSGAGVFTGPHVATSVVADAVTLLSNDWNDVNSFVVNTSTSASPYSTNWRSASTTTYRFGVVAGKGISFPYPGSYGPYQDFGTDGGVHNFLRFLENWGGQTLWYKGSIVSFYYNRQATGVYKCCNTVYSPPTRGYNFDSDFLTPTLLPPRTPLFRDVNTIGFTQTVLPTP